jgi:hypothetical protein
MSEMPAPIQDDVRLVRADDTTYSYARRVLQDGRRWIEIAALNAGGIFVGTIPNLPEEVCLYDIEIRSGMAYLDEGEIDLVIWLGPKGPLGERSGVSFVGKSIEECLAKAREGALEGMFGPRVNPAKWSRRLAGSP